MRENRPIERSRFRRPGRVQTLCALILLSPAVVPVGAQPSSTPAEHEKAADLFNFGRFMRHSNAPELRSSFDICILGPNTLGHSVEEIDSGGTINNLPSRIRRLPDVSDAKACDILFIGASEGDRVREDLAILDGSDALTVSDASDFLERGGMIQFQLVENHLRFAVNLNAVNRAHIILSSELLRLASSVSGKPAEEKP